MRNVSPPDPVLAYFEYRFSPFYATLPAESLPLPSALSSPSSGAAVRWLTHRFERPPTEGERMLDSARRELLQQLYDDASAEENGPSPSGWLDSIFGSK